MAQRARAHKDDGVVVSPICLGGVERLQRIQLDRHLLRLAGDVLDEVRVVEDDRFPMEQCIQGRNH